MATMSPETRRAKQRAYHHKNRAMRNAKSHAYRLAHHAQVLQKQREWRIANRAILNEKHRAKLALLTEEEKEAKRRYNHAYYAANREAILAQKRWYNVAHPENHKTQRRRRRARIAGAPINDFTHAQWLEIQEAQHHSCYYCGKRCKGHLSQDHITPLSQGGSHTIQNIVGVCRPCNSKKHDGPPLISVQPFLLSVTPPKKKRASTAAQVR